MSILKKKTIFECFFSRSSYLCEKTCFIENKTQMFFSNCITNPIYSTSQLFFQTRLRTVQAFHQSFHISLVTKQIPIVSTNCFITFPILFRCKGSVRPAVFTRCRVLRPYHVTQAEYPLQFMTCRCSEML